MERLYEKNRNILLFLFVAISFLAGCAKEEAPPGDYRPMLFFDGVLWGDTGNSVETLPDGFEEAGSVGNVISQTEPFVRGEGTSNTLPQGTAVYTSDNTNDRLCAAFVRESGDTVYLEYIPIAE